MASWRYYLKVWISNERLDYLVLKWLRAPKAFAALSSMTAGSGSRALAEQMLAIAPFPAASIAAHQVTRAPPAVANARLRRATRLLGQGAITVTVGAQYSLNQAATALALAMHGAHGTAVVLSPGASGTSHGDAIRRTASGNGG